MPQQHQMPQREQQQQQQYYHSQCQQQQIMHHQTLQQTQQHSELIQPQSPQVQPQAHQTQQHLGEPGQCPDFRSMHLNQQIAGDQQIMPHNHNELQVHEQLMNCQKYT
eukprot:TRINITY_DN14792_c0_g1_i7.p1 TRINITY_DN14792_c0_g1~~TRINITY_DN14792_c0_g1_i7.p1  ORF type:complete len:108 (-),score=18.66 TRINITY_DN14792_c0_g1_i7:233-556(-)